MTGFARARRAMGDGELVVSVKTLNHRALDIHVDAPSAADPFENSVRALVKSRLEVAGTASAVAGRTSAVAGRMSAVAGRRSAVS